VHIQLSDAASLLWSSILTPFENQIIQPPDNYWQLGSQTCLVIKTSIYNVLPSSRVMALTGLLAADRSPANDLTTKL
jgi:hypothetical protein